MMKPIKEYEAMTLPDQESFLAHAAAELVQKMYYDNNSKGLEVFCKNLTVIQDRARDYMDCLAMLQREGDVYTKIYLLLEYMGRNGIDEDFVSGLTEIAERAQESFAQANGATLTEDEEREVMKNLHETLNQHEVAAMRETRNNQGSQATQKPTIPAA